jgi:hypothetical protein
VATSPYQPSALPYNPINYPTATNPIGFNNSTDPRVATANQRQLIAGQGDALQANDQALAQQYQAQAGGVQNYLQPIENTLATGGGGYTADQASQIELSPQQKQDIATNAGISAGVGNAAAVGGAERAAAATGGNPAAMATYRARAAQSQAANAGQASTGAQVAAQQAGSAGAQAVGQAQQAQQGQALGYYGNLQAQQNQAGQTEQALGQSAFGTEAGAGTTATGQVLQASQTPSTSDKIIGGIGGALGALADGKSPYLNDDGMDAVLGENGPEAIVNAASDPVRSDARFMDQGGVVPGTDPNTGLPAIPIGQTPMPPASSVPSPPTWLQRYMANAKQNQQKPATPGQQQPQQQWNKTTPYSQLGAGIGGALRNSFQKPPAAPPTNAMAPSAPPASAPTPVSAPSDSYTDVGAMETPMADGGMSRYMDDGGFGAGSGDSGILNNYLQDSQRDELAPAQPTSSGQQPQQGQQNSGSGIGKDIGEAAGLAMMFLEDGKPHMAEGGMHAGFHWSAPRPHQPHVPEGGYQPLGYRAKPMLADGRQALNGPPTPTQTEAWKSPDIKKDIAADSSYMADRGREEQWSRARGNPGGWADYDHSNMQDMAQTIHDKNASANALPQKQPMAGPGKSSPYAHPYPMKADGHFPYLDNGQAGQDTGMYPMSGDPNETPMQARSSMTGNNGRPQIITKPTMVHLKKSEMVVPLSYRPKAKVRPSAALPALTRARPVMANARG